MATPVLANVAPTVGAIITSAQVISFEITSTPALQRVMVFVRFPGARIEEVIWDGTDFTERYQGVSSRVAITNGFRYSVIRNPVWPDSPQFAIYAINTSAEELSSSWGYTISEAPTYSPATPSLPSFPIGVPAGPESGFVAHDQDYFLRIASTVLDTDYYQGLKAGEGYEVLQEQAAIASRISLAIQNTANGMLAGYARGGAFSEGTVEFYRTASTAGAVTVKAGSVVTSAGGRYFLVLSDAVFGASDLGPKPAVVRAIFQDWQHSASGQIITPGGITIPGEIDTIRTLIEDPPFQDTTIQVRQITDVTGGRPPMLDLLARANGIQRRIGETDPQLSYRLRNLPDNLTPAAVNRNMRILLAPYGATWQFNESWDTRFQTAYDMPATATRTNVFVYDDPRPRYAPSRDWYADDREQWGTFYVTVSKIQPILDYGGLYDDVALDAAHLTSSRSHGRRAISAYDIPGVLPSSSSFGLAYDGRDTRQDALLNSIWQMLQSIRAAGIVAGLQQEGW